jgi:hypothetical protein
MPRKDAQGDVLQCSFCGKSQDEVKRLIAGPTAYICEECIDLCNEILLEEGVAAPRKARTRLWTPKELHHKLDEYIIGQTKAKKMSVSHLLHLAFFTGLYDSRGQPYVVNSTMQSRTCLQLAVLPHGAESRPCAWQR